MRLALVACPAAATGISLSPIPAVAGGRVFMNSGDDERTMRQTAFALAGVGMTLAVAALSGAALGWFIDSKLDTTPIGILVGLVLGLACGIAAIWREVRTYLGN
jgi:F0F1-type ATP synthase assembly protein I